MSQVSAVRDRKHSTYNTPANPVAVEYPDLVEAGDLLIVQLASDNGSQVFTAAGWTSLGSETPSGVSGEVLYRTATGGEAGTTFDVTQANAGVDVAALVYAIRGDLNLGTPEAESFSSGSGNFNPPSLSPSGGDRLYLWLVTGMQRFGDRFINPWDENLQERIQFQVPDIACQALGSERLFEAATYDPPDMTLTGSPVYGAWTIAVPTDQPANGVFPIVESTSQGSWTGTSSTQTMNLPAGVQINDLLVATIASDGAASVSVNGWDEVETGNDAGNTIRGTVLQKVADGTEGASVTVNFSPSDGGSYLCRRISGADATKTESDSATDLNIIATWPSLTPTGGADAILWIADVAMDRTRVLRGWPVNFGAVPLLEQDGDLLSDGVAGGVLARNTATAAPGAGQVSTLDDWVTMTVAIYPSASPPPPPSGGGNRMGDGRAIRKPPRTPR